MRKKMITLSLTAVFMAAASVCADDTRLITAQDFIETLGQPAPIQEAAARGKKPRFRTRGIRTTARPPEITVQILFRSGSVEVADDFSKKQLAEAGKALSSDILKPYHFEIAGHTDSIGADDYNQDLSEKRARALKQYLIEQYHVSGNRFEIKGYGESCPVATNDTETGRAKNRRVVFRRLE